MVCPYCVFVSSSLCLFLVCIMLYVFVGVVYCSWLPVVLCLMLAFDCMCCFFVCCILSES